MVPVYRFVWQFIFATAIISISLFKIEAGGTHPKVASENSVG
jgi:hypothetical protein